MIPYRSLPEPENDVEERPPRNVPIFALVLLGLAAMRVLVAMIKQEHCGAEVGLATVIAMWAGRAAAGR